MISIDLARRLRDAGLQWHPRTGDRFTLLEPSMTGEVFTISDMMIEAHEFSTGTVLGFNGTTEWALDSVPLDVALWLPREDQLRALLGGRFELLRQERFEWVVRVRAGAGVADFAHPDAECAYALALLSAT